MKTYIDGFIERAKIAQKEYEKLSQEKWDEAVTIIAKTVYDNAEDFAELAVSETLMGNVPDKTNKNKNKALMIASDLQKKKSKGIIGTEKNGIKLIAKPIGVIAAITPITNPIVTPMSNAMFALKGGNAIIISPHHKAIRSSGETVRMINENLAKKNFTKNLVQIIEEHSRENTNELMRKSDTVIATGGGGMVKAAYSSGTPSYGVGAGNVQVIIEKGYDLKEAVPKIITGRSYDNGIICSSEQSVFIHEDDYKNALSEFAKNNCFIAGGEELQKIEEALFIEGEMNKHLIGKSAKEILEFAKVKTGFEPKIIVCDIKDENSILFREKMFPVLALKTYTNFEDAILKMKKNLEVEGQGHSVAIHSNNEEHIEKMAELLPFSRMLINQSSSVAGGSFNNGLAPTNTLGCGSWGGNSISENLTYKHLINISRISEYVENNNVPTPEEIFEI